VTRVFTDLSDRPLRKDAAENRQRLLQAAAQVFAEQGLDGSVEEVARVAGVGMGTLYRRFPTKEALIYALVRELQAEVLADARAALAMADGMGLEAFLHAAAARQASHRGCLPRLWMHGDDETADTAREIRGVIADLTRDAAAHGRVRAELTAADVLVVLWSVRGVIESTQPVVPDAWRRHLAVVLAGLRPSSVPLPGAPLTERQLQRIRDKHRLPA
jgi:AcrR family transcriptional regulator